MRLTKLYNIANDLAPFALSEEMCSRYGAYDNSGIIVDCGKEITGVLFALDLTKDAIQTAKQAGAECIITHHPAIYSPVRRLVKDGEGDAVLLAAREGISVLSCHLNLDCAESGVDESLMRALGGMKAEAMMNEVGSGCGYGRVYGVRPQTMETFVAGAKKVLGTERVLTYGNAPVKRVASFCGAGLSEESVAFALEHGADTLVSADGKHHVILSALEHGLNLVLFTHYASELFGFEAFYQRFSGLLKESGVRAELFRDGRLL